MFCRISLQCCKPFGARKKSCKVFQVEIKVSDFNHERYLPWEKSQVRKQELKENCPIYLIEK